MSDLDALLAGIVAHPHEHVRWLVMADWLEDHGFPERAELVRVHRELLRTCTDPDAHPERPHLHARMMELMRSGVRPCLPQNTLTLPGGVELRMSFIPPGSFLMGSPETEKFRLKDEALQEVRLAGGFWLGQTPVTQSQWLAITGTNPSRFRRNELPVEMVSFNEARQFCKKVSEQALGIRLLTEAEWEYACRAGTSTPYYWGDDLDGLNANCGGPFPYGTVISGPQLDQTTPVGSYAHFAPHPMGLVDMIGNVMEWCASRTTGTNDAGNPELEAQCVLRGGAWACGPEVSRSASRMVVSLDERHTFVGFRIAADLE